MAVTPAEVIPSSRATAAWILWAAYAVAAAATIDHCVLVYFGGPPQEGFEQLWPACFALLLAFWVEADSRSHPQIERPSFDFGALIYAFGVVYVPYYLLRTRGRTRWWWIAGFFGALAAPYVVPAFIYLALGG